MLKTPYSDTVVGVGAAALGGGGLTLQAFTESMSLTLLTLNILLAVVGLTIGAFRLHRLYQKHHRQK